MVISSKQCLKDIAVNYQRIGSALLLVELQQMRSIYSLSSSTSNDCSNKIFREGVACVSTPVLRTYLEDLLKSNFKDEHLFIKRQPLIYRTSFILRVLLALICGLFITIGNYSVINLDLPIYALLAAYASLLLPILMVFYRSPFFAISRRLIFARLLSYEIERRSGNGLGNSSNSYLGFKNGSFSIANNYAFSEHSLIQPLSLN
jgi:hypothetical protein